MARRIKERKLRNPAITIIGEGATERYYFTHRFYHAYNFLLSDTSDRGSMVLYKQSIL